MQAKPFISSLFLFHIAKYFEIYASRSFLPLRKSCASCLKSYHCTKIKEFQAFGKAKAGAPSTALFYHGPCTYCSCLFLPKIFCGVTPLLEGFGSSVTVSERPSPIFLCKVTHLSLTPSHPPWHIIYSLTTGFTTIKY